MVDAIPPRLRSRRWFDDPADPAMTALLQTGDWVRIDLDARRVDVLLREEELASRRAAWTPPVLEDLTPWERIYRSMVGQHATGACLEPATLFLNIVETRGESRHNH